MFDKVHRLKQNMRFCFLYKLNYSLGNSNDNDTSTFVARDKVEIRSVMSHDTLLYLVLTLANMPLRPRLEFIPPQVAVANAWHLQISLYFSGTP